MFVSKFLNKLFFNTNNECYFSTLLNLNQYMLTKGLYRAILDQSYNQVPEPAANNITIEVEGQGEGESNNELETSNEVDFGSSTNSSNDDLLLQRKNEFQREGRNITPIPFTVNTEPITPENVFRPIRASPVRGPSPSTQGPTKGCAEGLVETPFSGAYSPKQPDTLFWCIFIIANGYGEYINVGRNYGVKELEIKQKVGEFVSKCEYKKYATNYKITNALRQEIHSELLTSQKETSFPCLMVLCCFYKINVVLVHPTSKIMLEFVSDNDEDTPYYVLKRDNVGKYSVDTDKKTWKDIQEMKGRLVCLDNYLKPMKAMGNYKIDDLEALANRLGVFDGTKKYKKAELYQTVCQALQWESPSIKK